MFAINKWQHCEYAIFFKKKKTTRQNYLLSACTRVIILLYITVAKQASPIS